jgi:HlyD family secretion protein
MLMVAVIVVLVGLLGIRVMMGRRGVSEASVAKASLLGISVQDSPGKGVLITAVHANSLAEQHGLQPNDLILGINEAPVEDERDYQQILDKALTQKSLVFLVKRASREIRVRFTMEYAAAYNNLGNAYVKDKHYDEAIEAYQEALTIDPKFAEAYYNLGSVYTQQKKYDLAIEHYRKAIDLRRDFREAYHKLAEVYDKQGKRADAIKTYKEILQSAPSDTVASELRPVEIIHAAQGEIKDQLKFSGTIEPRARVTVFPKAVGVVEKMMVDQGDMVEKDQILAMVEHEELELQVQQAEAAVAAAQAGYDQTKQLAKIRIMSQVAQARAGAEAAEAALQQVHDLAETRTLTQIQQAKAALDALKANMEKIRRGAREEEREQVRATVAQANASLANAQSNYERMKRLFDAGAVSRQTYEGVETQLEVTKAQSLAAKEQWNMVEEGAREEDIQAMEAQVKQAEAGFKLAQKQAEKQTWQKDITMAEAQAEQARAALESAETSVKAESWKAEIIGAETQLTQAVVMRDLARKRLADAYIKAPIKGVVSVRHLDEGSMVNPAAPMFELVDMDEVHADVDVLESDLSKIHVEDAAWIHVSALDDPVKSLVTSISPTVDEMSRTARVEITVENPGHLLKPGMFAQVFVPTDVRSAAVLLPRSAVIEDEANSERYVFVADSGKSRKTIVEYGLTEGSLVEIAKGLDVGAPVVIAGQQNLSDGDFIQIVGVTTGH